MKHRHTPLDKSFDEFKAHLARRHRQNYAHRQQNLAGSALADARAERFGRYLRAARLNANLSPAALGQRAKLSPDTILALEQGLILSQDIKAGWLKRLAAALHENVDDFALLLGRKRLSRWNWPALNWGGLLPAPRLSRTAYAPLFAALLAVVVSVTMLANIGLPLALPGDDLVYTTPETLILPQTVPVSVPISAYPNLDPVGRLSLLKAERLKVAPVAAPAPVAASSSPIIEANPVTYLFLNSKLDHPQAEPKHRIQIFFDIVYWLTVGPRFQLEGRPSIISAEYKIENQILVQPKIININSEDRLNMVNAEIRL